MPKASLNRSSKLIYFAPALSWGIFISIITLLPSDRFPKVVQDANDKIIHAAVYFLLVFLIYLGISAFRLRFWISNYSLALIILGAALHGALIEVLQHHFVRGRIGDWNDFLANTIGLFFSLIFILVLRKRK